ncbi:MAG: arginine--tRNA ligase [Defluviitaleaceae bacterium]|nr:arginine--tRNA ligase [Defluviitaleaceae bacterium]
MDYKASLASLLSPIVQLDAAEILPFIESPPDPAMGHFAFPCFRLAKTLKKAPPVIAQDVAEAVTMTALVLNEYHWIDRAVATGPYVNFFLREAAFMDDTLRAVLAAGADYGKPAPAIQSAHAAQKILIEYSSPNIAKHFHPGHFANTVIGNALVRIYRHLGYDVTSINHLGDFGTQFGKLIVAYQRWGSREEIERTEIDGLVKIYVKFHEEADHDPTLNDEARTWVVKMQDGNKEALELWQWFVTLSNRSFDRIYKRLDATFDRVRGESYYTDKLDAAVQTIRDKGILVESEGAQIVDLEAYNLPPCMILRSDGGTLYATRDIAAALDRHAEYNFDKCIYIIANEQNTYCAQWFKVMELMGFPWAQNLLHVTYGMYRFESGKMSTRRGDVIKMEELIDEAVEKTRLIIEEKNPNLPNKESVAEQVGLGALIFNRLYNSRIKDTVFNWQNMINFDGETGPYVQYCHARTCSVLDKAAEKGVLPAEFTDFDASHLTGNEAFNVARILYDYPQAIAEAADKNEPYLIARHLMALAQAFNAFYHHNIILTDAAHIQTARLALTAAVQSVLQNGMQLLAIHAPRAM